MGGTAQPQSAKDRQESQRQTNCLIVPEAAQQYPLKFPKHFWVLDVLSILQYFSVVLYLLLYVIFVDFVCLHVLIHFETQ